MQRPYKHLQNRPNVCRPGLNQSVSDPLGDQSVSIHVDAKAQMQADADAKQMGSQGVEPVLSCFGEVWAQM